VEAALSGSDHCAPHDAKEKAIAKAKQRRRRKRRAEAGICIAGCGRKVGKRRPKSGRGTPQPRRCPRCAKAHAEAARERRGVPPVKRGVPNAGADPAPLTKLEVHADGYTRIRTIGRGRAGRMTREETDDELRADCAAAESSIAWARVEGIARLRSDVVTSLGRIAKQEAASIVADRLRGAGRAALVVAHSLDPSGTRDLIQLLAELANAGDDE